MATTRNPIPKNSQSEQLCRVGTPAAAISGGAGTPDLLDTATSPLADQYGRLIVVLDSADPSSAGLYKAERFLTSGASFVSQIATIVQSTILTQVAGYNAGTDAAFLQIWETDGFDVVNGFATLVAVFQVPGNRTTFSYGVQVVHTAPGAGSRFIIGLSSDEFTMVELPAPVLHCTANYKQ
jgi:hypothetical protein